MTPTVHYPPPNAAARRASTVLFGIAGVATLFGLMLLVGASDVSQLEHDPTVRTQLDPLRTQYHVDPRHVFMGFGVGVLAYAATAFVLGLTARGGRPAACVVAAVLTTLAAAGGGLITVLSLAVGNGAGAVLFLAFTVAHGSCAVWLTAAAAAGTTPPVVSQRMPLQDYYLPPVEPAAAVYR